MKKFNLFSIALLAGILTFVGIVHAARVDGYTLKEVNQVDYGTETSMSKGNFLVDVDNSTPNSDAQLAVTLNKKNIFGKFSNVTRVQKWITNLPNVQFPFGSQSKGTYRAHVIFNDSNDNKEISGQYQLR